MIRSPFSQTGRQLHLLQWSLQSIVDCCSFFFFFYSFSLAVSRELGRLEFAVVIVLAKVNSLWNYLVVILQCGFVTAE